MALARSAETVWLAISVLAVAALPTTDRMAATDQARTAVLAAMAAGVLAVGLRTAAMLLPEQAPAEGVAATLLAATQSQEVQALTGFVLIDTLLAGRLDSFGEALRHLALPAITLGLPSAAILMRVTRSSKSSTRALSRGVAPLVTVAFAESSRRTWEPSAVRSSMRPSTSCTTEGSAP